MFIFGGIILLLVIVIITLIQKIKSKNLTIEVTETELKTIFERYEFSQRELDRCKEQIKIYEKKDEEVKEITFTKNKKIKVSSCHCGISNHSGNNRICCHGTPFFTQQAGHS